MTSFTSKTEEEEEEVYTEATQQDLETNLKQQYPSENCRDTVER